LPSGEHACLRPETTPLDRYRLNPDRVVIADPVSAAPKFIPRDQLHRFIVSSQTVYLVYAETAERALQWFSDPTDIDLDVETLDFGEVEVFGQLSPEEQLDDEPRYWITNQGRVALAEARREEIVRLVGPFDRTRSVAAKQSLEQEDDHVD